MGLFSLFSKKPQETGDDLDPAAKPRRSRVGKPSNDEPVDPMLPEKKRARRRLIGAVALVLAAIIGLPMVFDSEPKPLSDDIDIQIPSRDKTAPATSNPMPLPPEPGTSEPKAEAVSRADSAIPSPVAASTPAFTAAPADKAPAETGPAVVKGSTDTKSAVASQPAPVSGPPKPLPVQTSSPARPAAGAQESAAAATDKIAEKIAEKSRARFVVQVAAVSSQAKADQLLNRLKKAGIQSYSQKISTRDGERFRIRLGPFSSREEADKARSRLSPLRLSGTVQSL